MALALAVFEHFLEFFFFFLVLYVTKIEGKCLGFFSILSVSLSDTVCIKFGSFQHLLAFSIWMAFYRYEI